MRKDTGVFVSSPGCSLVLGDIGVAFCEPHRGGLGACAIPERGERAEQSEPYDCVWYFGNQKDRIERVENRTKRRILLALIVRPGNRCINRADRTVHEGGRWGGGESNGSPGSKGSQFRDLGSDVRICGPEGESRKLTLNLPPSNRTETAYALLDQEDEAYGVSSRSKTTDDE